MDLKKSGERLKELRKALKLKQPELAEKAGVSQPLISDLENGKKHLTGFAAAGLASVLGAEVWELAPQTAHVPKGYIISSDAGKRMRPQEDEEHVGRLCNADRIPGAIRSELDGKIRWLIPENFRVLPNPAGWGRISDRRKNAIARRYLNGESGPDLAKEYGINHSYPRKLA